MMHPFRLKGGFFSEKVDQYNNGFVLKHVFIDALFLYAILETWPIGVL